MNKLLPQEIQVWYVIPVIRKELSKFLVKDQGITQKKAAEMLSLTEGAVSQYLNSKRGTKIKFNDKILDEIKASAKRISQKPSKVLEETIRLLNLEDMKKVICDFHKKNDPSLDEDCDICRKYWK
ncbi:MAG: transcriptional regulator [Nanobdellota archaeon]